MSAPGESRLADARTFRIRLLVAMMLVVGALTSLGIFVAQHRAAEDAENDLQRDFELELAALHRLQDLRNAAVADRSRALVRNARIHAALEDNALDLLYPSAAEELRDLMENEDPVRTETAETLHARFYRFLDGTGAVLAPPPGEAGELLPNEQEKLAQPGAPQTMQTGYLHRIDAAGRPTVDEMIAVPIRSTETNQVIAALVLGFKSVAAMGHISATGMQSGILVGNQLYLPAYESAVEARIASEVKKDVEQFGQRHQSLQTTVGNLPHLLFYRQLNLRSTYPPAYEVCVYPLTRLLARQRQLRTQILGAGGILLLGGFVVSQFIAARLARPVEKLAVVSEKNRAQRKEAEAKLQTTEEELQRSARFSADASHQLKSPITVLRAGLDSLLTRDGFPREVYEEISSLIHQTYRLTGVVEDLLLLSRMDAGKLRLNLNTVDLSHLVAEWIDDLRAMPAAADLQIEINVPEHLRIAGERQFTALIVQNMLDNARKYNRPGGIIRVSAVLHASRNEVDVRVANTGRGIPREAQPYIFERFHRGGAGSDVPGHGLGLNLARELARLHGGDLRLIQSDGEWTEFSACFCAAPRSVSTGLS